MTKPRFQSYLGNNVQSFWYVFFSDATQVSITGWQAHDDIWRALGCHAACLGTARTYGCGMTEKPGGVEVPVSAYFTAVVPFKIQTSAIEHRCPNHNFRRTPEGEGWTTASACFEECVACTTGIYLPALLSAIAGNQAAVAVGLVPKITPLIMEFTT